MGRKRKKAPYRYLKATVITIFMLFLLASVATGGAVLAIIKSAPALDVNEILTLNEPSKLFNDKDDFMDVVVTNEQRTVIPFNIMPQQLKDAFVSIEDERFYTHKGIDIKRIAGVVIIDIKNKISGQSGLQGASTITQQLVRNTILSSEVTLKRKIQEMYLSVQLENYLTKDQILEGYMNTIWLGGKAYGVEAAAQQYFSTPAEKLSLIQCAFIAGIPQSPTLFYSSTVLKSNPSAYINRTETVLMKMHENGYITQQQYESALNDLSSNKLTFKPNVAPNRLDYEYFSIPAIEQVKNDLKAQYHYNDTQVQHLLMYGGLKIFTTMNKDIQYNTQKTLNDDSTFGIESRKDKNGILQPQASAVIMDYHTGEIKSIIGGRGNQPPMSHNRAAAVSYLSPYTRSPGSSIKPLTVYGAAIDSKQATAATVIADSPLSEDIAKLYGQSGKQYPRNDYEGYGAYGENITLRTALVHSVNTVAVKLENQIGLKTGIEYAEKFGLNLNARDKTSIAALSLGQTHGTTPLTMAAAYGVFGNAGNYTTPRLYRKVLDRSGKIILENKVQSKQVLSPESAYIMYDLLKGPVSSEGTGPRANFGSMPVRGKTGTSSDNKDLWFVGLTPYYSAAVWIGNDDYSAIGSGKYGYESGLISNTAAKAWSLIMKPVHQNLEPKDLDMPSGVVSAVVCSESGKLPTSACFNDPTGNKPYTELFVDGTVPADYCNFPHSSGKNDSNSDSNSILDKILRPFKGGSDTENNTNDVNKDTNTNTNTNTNLDPNSDNVNPNNNTNNDENINNSTNSDNTTPKNNLNPKKPTILN
ncbi:transglycosylase domain-containing protein [Clostridium sp. DJ247]|uniref:transglycosylase domain-containing protein n=1 Tax=Clostridium sp. DJ247 TaxID=2726188 RepID=UPI0016241A3A|nr:PBP1A family penicillin-binding protein [Clostridium sp. DJ247]MBC2581166.1 PBP1A family penicillin-binding protein [Clostridium sp. DJ247]